MTIKKTLQATVIGFVVIMAWVLGGIMAIPQDIVLLDTDIRVSKLQQGEITEPSDIQPALGYRVVENSYNPQQQ